MDGPLNGYFQVPSGEVRQAEGCLWLHYHFEIPDIAVCVCWCFILEIFAHPYTETERPLGIYNFHRRYPVWRGVPRAHTDSNHSWANKTPFGIPFF